MLVAERTVVFVGLSSFSCSLASNGMQQRQNNNVSLLRERE